MSQRIIVITGASNGIGAAAARRLSASGHQVAVVGRSATKTAAVAAELGCPSFVADFARLADVRSLAVALADRFTRIDVLANNAGGIMGERELTEDGFERTFQVNHLAPFLLTNLLLDTLVSSRASVINTASLAARQGAALDLDDVNLQKGYSAFRAYAQSKFANIVFTRGLHQRFHTDGLSTAAFHPGVIASNFAADSGSPLRVLYRTPLRRLLPSNEHGADTLVWLAETRPNLDWTSGDYYQNRRPGRTTPRAFEESMVNGLWARSAAMVGLTP